ncbi:hypothetical protein CEP52_009790 [Fusarium oligoseptatum]|uniref:Uncharacterized protein n=1 Tax=Fusarium oligoseptatum TaxID=2604345 RepID=A0A428TBI1_9HYPO|nr:hypothetical protein CEP52_009790 [Fusarium oligoseptatum]
MGWLWSSSNKDKPSTPSEEAPPTSTPTQPPNLNLNLNLLHHHRPRDPKVHRPLRIRKEHQALTPVTKRPTTILFIITIMAHPQKVNTNHNPNPIRHTPARRPLRSPPPDRHVMPTSL